MSININTYILDQLLLLKIPKEMADVVSIIENCLVYTIYNTGHIVLLLTRKVTF